jgi:hypothetical protein
LKKMPCILRRRTTCVAVARPNSDLPMSLKGFRRITRSDF